MGANMVRRLHAGGHECVVYDVIDDAVDALDAEGVTAHGSKTLEDFVAALTPPRQVWLMVPAAFVGDTVALAGAAARAGRHDHRRRQLVVPRRRRPVGGARARGHHTTSTSARAGGVFGLERGYCLMIGGDADAVDRLAPIFDTLAPGVDSAERTPGRERRPDARGAGLAALRAERRRALREDGAQRHRVRADGGLRRGPQRAAPRPTSAPRPTPPTPRPHRSTPAAVLPVRPRPVGGHRGVAARQSVASPGCSTSPPTRCYADPELDAFSGVVSDSVKAGGRSARPSTRASRCRCSRPRCTAVLVAGPRRHGRQGAVGDACRFRRAPRTNGIHPMMYSHIDSAQIETKQPTADALVLFGATGDLAKRRLFPALYRLERSGMLTRSGDRGGSQRLDRCRHPRPREGVDLRTWFGKPIRWLKFC